MKYIARIKKDGKYWNITFPDAEGCVTFCKNKKDIKSTALEALVGWLKAEVTMGCNVPEPKANFTDSSIIIDVPEDIAAIVRSNKLD